METFTFIICHLAMALSAAGVLVSGPVMNHKRRKAAKIKTVKANIKTEKPLQHMVMSLLEISVH